MDDQISHLVVNHIRIEDNFILVGATDNERWRWDKQEGMSGSDAKTIVYVVLTDNGKGYVVSEKAGFHCSPGDPTRIIAMSYLMELFEIAWAIKNGKLDLKNAHDRYFGKEINKATNII